MLENAITSIQLGIEDYVNDDPRRRISAVRNFYAGVLLLGKHCLLQVVPDVDPMEILAAKFEPEPDGNGGVKYQPSGFRTIDLSELRGRFKKFDLEWPSGDIDRLQKLRNDFEHFHSLETKEQIQRIISKCFPIVEKFFEILELNPASELGEAWKVMLKEAQFFNDKQKKCLDTFSKLPWPKLQFFKEIECSECSSTLLFQLDPENSNPEDIEVECMACAKRFDAQTFVEMVISNEFGVDDYSSVKDGGDPTINDCPECHSETYVSTYGINMCFWCGFELNSECEICTESLSVSNISYDNYNICCYCENRFSKDD